MKKVLLLSVLVLLVGAGSAKGRTTIVVEDGEPDWPYQRWVDRAQMPTPDSEIWVLERDCPMPGKMACAFHEIKWIYYPPATPKAPLILYHELGHIQMPFASERQVDLYASCALDYRRPWTRRAHELWWVGISNRPMRVKRFRRACFRLAIRHKQPRGAVTNPG